MRKLKLIPKVDTNSSALMLQFTINASPFSGEPKFELEKFPSVHKTHLSPLFGDFFDNWDTYANSYNSKHLESDTSLVCLICFLQLSLLPWS